MEEDDSDFTPTHNTSSNLASLFGLSKTQVHGNSSLTYTPPKAPKKDTVPVKNVKSSKTVIICSKAVQAYKLDNRKYLSQGLAGLVINGNHESHSYGIILYKPSKEYLSCTTITKAFTLTLSANNYVSYYDTKRENWSVMFETADDVKYFVEKVAICKFYTNVDDPQNILIQDLTPLSNIKATTGSTVDITYSSFSANQESIVPIKENVNEKVNLSNISLLAKCLVGCSEASERVVIVPNSLSDAWINDLEKKGDLLLRIKVSKIISQLETSLLESKAKIDNAESSTEESSVNDQGVCLKEANANSMSQKASLISRMARMGQATLPLKPTRAPSDSEEECTVSSPLRHKIHRNKSGMNSHHYMGPMPQTLPSEPMTQLPVHQHDLSTQQMQLSKFGVPHQMIPVSTGPILSPTTDPTVSVFLSESRIQATELRMAVGKLSDKMDLILNKIQNLSANDAETKANSSCMVDPSGILLGIQNLLNENDRLKEKVEDQKSKLEQQNDRIYNLLELNHKYVQQNTNSVDKQTETEIKLRKEIEFFVKKEVQLEVDNKKYIERIKTLEEELEKSEETKHKMEKRSNELSVQLNNFKKDAEGSGSMKQAIENYEVKLSNASENITNLKQKLKELEVENETLKSLTEKQMEDDNTRKTEQKVSKMRIDEYQKMIKDLTSEISQNKSQYEATINSLKNSISKLEEEQTHYLSKNNEENERNESNKVLGQLFNDLKNKFCQSSNFTSSSILTILQNSFCQYGFTGTHESSCGDAQGNLFNQSAEPGAQQTTLEVPDSKIDDLQTKSQIVEKNENVNSTESEIKSDASTESNSRCKSYDQGWRTTKPPPPPLFDDDCDDDVDDWLH